MVEKISRAEELQHRKPEVTGRATGEELWLAGKFALIINVDLILAQSHRRGCQLPQPQGVCCSRLCRMKRLLQDHADHVVRFFGAVTKHWDRGKSDSGLRVLLHSPWLCYF